jgi:predicted ATPase/DNA-binding SARP family transcriptional activator
MGHLSLSFLGGFEVTLGAEPLTAFGADKVRALLAFLAIESSRPHHRSELSAMFWPELSEKSAAHNLSQTLLRLRQALREKTNPASASFLSASARDIQFNLYSDYQLDVARFRELLRLVEQHKHQETTTCAACIQWLQQAAELYHGDLLAGLFVPESIVFEEWRLVQQEELHRQALELLSRLVSHHEQRGDFERVQDYARRQIALEPWREEAHLQLMRALAHSGQTSAAMRQYELYQRTLAEELDIKPSAEVTRLYEQIRAGEIEQKAGAQPGVGQAVWLSSQGERRQVTTLVCGREPQGDSEDRKEQLALCERHCGAIFNRFGGRRALRQGQACLVYFGYPQAYEDSARRAVHSALALAAALEGDGDVRIGIHTGLMTVGEKRGRRWQDRDLFGAALELARDCQRAAGPGEVLLTEATRRLVQEFFELRARGPQVLGTPGRPVPLYQVRGESSVQSRLEWLAQTQRLTVFAGRSEELARLETCHEMVRQGRGQVVFLRGEPGIGKSRLLWELEKTKTLPGVSDAGAQTEHPFLLWLASRCLPHYQNTSLFPVIGLLERLLGFQAGDSLEVRLEKLTGMLTHYHLDHPSAAWLLSILLGLPTEAPAPETVTKSQREQMRELFLTLLQKRAAEGPLALVIEDLHWSDPSTVDWLGGSIASLAAIPCLTLLTARPGFKPEWLSQKELQPGFHMLSLTPLPPEEAGKMVSDLAGENVLDQETRRDIVTQTDGIPLFIEELTKTLLERPVYKGDSIKTSEIPATLLDSLAARLDHLGPAKETAQWAAALGREFSYHILQACLPYGEERLQHDLACLVEAELVSPLQGASPDAATLRYAFKHTLVQETAYASLLKRSCQAYHARIAETLELRFPQVAGARPEVLAQHYASAGLRGKAVDFWLQAGDRATAQGATLEARIFYDSALEGIEPGDQERRWRALWGRETALFFRGERPAQKTDIEALLELAEALDDDLRRAQAQTRLARFATSQSDYRGQLQAAQAAILAASRAGALTVELEALAYKVTALMRLGERGALPGVVEQALDRAQKVEDEAIRAYAMAAVALYYVESGDLARAAQSLNESLEAARRSSIRRLDLEAQYYGHLGFTYAQLGLYAQALQALEAGLALATLMGLGRYQAYHKLNLGFVYWRLGDLDTAVRMEEQVLQEYSATGEAFGQAASRAYLAYIYEAKGNLAFAAENLAQARQGFAEIGVDTEKIEVQAVQARVALAQGRQEQAREMTGEVWKYLCEQGTEGLGSPTWVFACIADVLDRIEIPGISSHDVIEAGYRDLMQRAEKISDPDWRRSFIEDVAENRAIVERWKAK